MDLIRESLKERLKLKKKIFQMGRLKGTSQEAQQMINKFNEDDEKKLETLKELRQETSKMSKKEAMKYLNNVRGMMNDEQTKEFSNMMKEKLPSHHAKQVNTILQNKKPKKLDEKEDEKKTKVNQETVYIPTSELSEEQKQKLKNEQQAPKKKKTFGQVKVHMPNFQELQQQDSLLFQKTTKELDLELFRNNFTNFQKCFSDSKTTTTTVIEMCLDTWKNTYYPIPGTEETTDEKKLNDKITYQGTNKKWILEQKNSGLITKTENAYPDLLTMLGPCKNLFQFLKNHIPEKNKLIDILENNFGIFMDPKNPEMFLIVVNVRKYPQNNYLFVPFLKIKFSS